MSNNPTDKKAWKILQKLSQTPLNLNDLFAENPARFDDFSLSMDGLFFDYSKQKITAEILQNLIALAKDSGVEEKRDAMFRGDLINHTEQRAVLHTALRAPENNHPEIQETLGRIEKLSATLRTQKYLGATGKVITDVVSIGIGGSDLGPRMVYQALNDHHQPIKLHFVSNIDADDIESVLVKCNPETTLFIVISKTFGTQETLTNARTALAWVQNALRNDTDISNHFIAVSANVKAAKAFGIKTENIYPLWDWVNGRFSLWSAVGLPIAIGLGFDKFSNLLKGAYAMDRHFQTAPLERNIPVLMAMVGIWNVNFGDTHNLAVLPYAQNLSLFPSYLQQLEMESNGKSVDNQGRKITGYATAPVLFGEAGTNGQHSFYQLLHQGSATIPCDFIGVINPNHTHKNHHDFLNGHLLAQGQAMMQGKSNPEHPHQNFTGNKPSSTILLDKLDAYHLGMLIALYEHKVMVQGAIWKVNSFDQFGVELGKEMAADIENHNLDNLDPSTKALYSLIHKHLK